MVGHNRSLNQKKGGSKMAATAFDRRLSWVPPSRPDWLSSLNAVGGMVGDRGVVSLDPASLIAQAIENTGLSDFGDEPWREAFETLLDAIDREANLNLAGRLLTRCEFILYLEARLQIVAAYRREPEIDAEQIDRPVYITGYARSGTTILFEVLAQDPQFRVAAKFEALIPSPPPEAETYGSDERIARVDQYNDLLEEMLPLFKSAHKSGAILPVETLEIEYPTFLSDVFTIQFQIPSYARYMAARDHTSTIEWQRKTLKMLQRRFKRPHWLMKSPSHLPHLRKILRVFPDMRVIFTHRDPVITADSVVSVMGLLYSLRTDQPWGDGSIESWSLATAEARAAAWDDVIDLIESGVLAKGRYANFQYAEFMDDPMASIRGVYRALEMELAPEVEARMLSFLRDKTQGRFGRHQYEATPVDVIDTERTAYRRYQEFFSVPAEI